MRLPPPEPREFRAAWVATVANIDWPSQPGLPADAQRAEAMRHARPRRGHRPERAHPAGAAGRRRALPVGAGAVERIPHRRAGPRPGAGLGPAGLVGAARRRPAASSCTSGSTPTARAIRRRRRRWRRRTWRCASRRWSGATATSCGWTPASRAAAAHTLAVVADVVRRYDIDGVHIDDYFYPYPVKVGDADLPFPDDAAYARYRLGGGPLARDDWRRANVDALVQEMHATVQRIKPWVRFGISPFGLGRPDRRPPGVTGFSQYDKLYADVERWLENGWLDYLAPQLYWPIDRAGQAFPVLLDYWIGAEPRAPPRLAGAVHEPGHARRAAGPARLAGARDPRPGGAAAHAARRQRPHPLQHGGADAGPRRRRHAAADRPLRHAGAGAGHALARRPAAAGAAAAAGRVAGGDRARRR